MAIKRMCRNAVHFKEFQNDPVTGHHYVATCGETALAAAMVCATPQIESKQEAINLMTSMTREMMAKGWADKPNGASRTATLELEAKLRGFTVASPYVGWEDPIKSDQLHPWLLQYAGIMPIVLMVTHAGEGLVAIDGSRAERGVFGHFVCVVGLADEGYVTMDGDNNRIESELPIYSWAALEKAHVTGFLMLELQGGSKVAVPSNWTDANGVITAPNKVQVVSGFAQYIRDHEWAEYNVPLRAESGDGHGGSHQRFKCGQLYWSQATNVVEDNLGEQLDAAEQQIAVLQKQLADVQAQLATATKLSGQEQTDLAVMAAIRAAMATHA